MNTGRLNLVSLAMHKLPDVMKSQLVDHPANLFVSIRTLDYGAGSVRLNMRLRSQFVAASYASSALACAFDYLARVAGYEPLGHCTPVESEVTFLPGPHVLEFIATAAIASVDDKYATYTSSIYAPDRTLIAHASGTLMGTRSHLTLVSDSSRLSGACVG